MKRFVWASLLLLAASCGPDNGLGGSVSDLFPLGISRVDVLRNDEALQVSYYNNNGADVDLVIRLTVALDGLTLKPGSHVKLQGEYAPGHERTTVAHQAGGEPERLLGTVKQGLLNLNGGGAPGQKTSGTFNLLFEPGDDFAAGRDLSGSFSQTALDAGFDPILP